MIKEFVDAVRKMRQFQKDYFATRDPNTLCYARRAEKEIDAMLEKISNPSLFDAPEVQEGGRFEVRLEAPHDARLSRHTNPPLSEIKRIERDFAQSAVDTFGSASQVGMLHEEVGELLSALNKFARGRCSREAVITEIADVQIMCEQMAVIFGAENVDAERKRKFMRLAERIAEHKKNN